jgi:hypothetical protein
VHGRSAAADSDEPSDLLSRGAGIHVAR